MLKEATVFCDGGARGNPGPAGAGAVLMSGREVIGKSGKFLGEATNNIAEYRGLLLGLAIAKQHQVDHLHICLDSELVVKQVLGEYKVKNPGLKPLWEKVKIQLTHFNKWDIMHVPREKNKEADRMVNEAIDQRLT